MPGPDPRFLNASEDPAGAAAVLLGVPFDGTSSYRGGSGKGPAAIRRASHCLETYSPVLDRDLDDLSCADLGDLPCDGLLPGDVVASVQRALGDLSPSVLPALLGGEHTVTLGAVRALAARHPDLAVLQVDAHADLRDEYQGERVGHATVMRRVLEVVRGPLVQVGVRSGTREELAVARAAARHTSAALALPAAVYADLARGPVYLTVDIDVVDPAFAPGTDSPEPGGPTAGELLAFLYTLRDLRVVGVDVVEVAPAHDAGEITAVLAAKVVRECLLMFATAPTPL
ncbi:MAG: agmatinase [Armatimonadetes bacterium]|nr:agmatinase [Armatimonadota bacterium]